MRNVIEGKKLSNVNIQALWQEYEKDHSVEIKNELVLYYLKLVNKVVLRMMPTYNNFIDYDDLISNGVLGLMDAIEKYDYTLNTSFESYAKKRIHGEIIDSLRRSDWASVSLRSKLKQLREAEQALQSKLSRNITEQDIADEMEVPLEKVYELKNKEHIFNMIHLESILNKSDIGETSFDDLMKDDNAITGYGVLSQKEMQKELASLIDKLNEKEKLTIQLYYFEELKIKEIAQVLEVSESRVSQLHSSALKKLRKGMEKENIN